MAMSEQTFNSYLAKILSARYGEEVRGSIHDSLQGMYEIVKQNTLDVSAASQMMAAVDSLNKIKTDATNAANAANTAASNLNKLKTEASNAANAANTAASNANKAVSDANSAVKKANDAAAAANNATLAAQSATSNANAAASRTNTAISKANEAANSVNEAKQAAIDAANSVEEAKTAAMNAANSVEEAKTAATEAASKANTAASNADAATAKANASATKADTATSKANTAASNADTATSKANTAASNADTATSKANEAANSVNEAKQAATEATSKANTAASNADEATSKANTAASNANEKATAAAEATTNATQAADRANSAAQIVEDLQIGDLDVGSIATKDYVSEQIDAIEIGGRNLLVGSDFSGKVNPSIASGDYVFEGDTVTWDVVEANDKWNGFSIPISDYCLQNIRGRNIVISFDYMMHKNFEIEYDNFVGLEFDVEYDNGSPTVPYFVYVADAPHIVGIWKRYSKIIKINDSNVKSVSVALFFRKTSGKISFRHPKIEFGNKPTDWTPAPEDVDAKIDGIEIGGRNLLLNSSMSSNLNGWYQDGGLDWEIVTEDGYKCAHIAGSADISRGIRQINITDRFTPTAKTVHTISAWVNLKNFKSAEGNAGYIYFYLRAYYDEDGTPTWMGAMDASSGLQQTGKMGNFANAVNNKGWQRVTWKFYFDHDVLNNGTSENSVMLCIYANYFTGDLYIRDIKLERGNMATDWSPAPEDMQPAIFDSNGNVQLTIDNLQKLAISLKTYLN